METPESLNVPQVRTPVKRIFLKHWLAIERYTEKVREYRGPVDAEPNTCLGPLEHHMSFITSLRGIETL